MDGQHEVRIRLMNEPALWCWEVVEPRTGSIVESSWDARWEAWDSREDAIAAARRTLTLRARAPRATARRQVVA
jgi:hypothetical protein